MRTLCITLSLVLFVFYLSSPFYSDYDQIEQGYAYLLFGLFFEVPIALLAIFTGALEGVWHVFSWFSHIGLVVGVLLLKAKRVTVSRAVLLVSMLCSFQLYFYGQASLGPDYTSVEVNLESGYYYYVASMAVALVASLVPTKLPSLKGVFKF